MTIYRILFIVFLFNVHVLTATEPLNNWGDIEHYLGLKVIIQPVETENVKPPGYRGRLIIQNQINDTFKFINTSNEKLSIIRIVSDDSLHFLFSSSVAPGATGYVIYRKDFYPDGKGLEHFNFKFSIQTDKGLIKGYLIDYMVLHPCRRDIYFPKEKSNQGYRIVYDENRELRIELDSSSNILQYGLYHTGFNQNIGFWRYYSKDKLNKTVNFSKCYPIIVYNMVLKPCLSFQVKVLLDNGKWEPARLYSKGNRVDLIIDQNVQKVLVEQGDSSDWRAIDFKQLPDWRNYALVFELKSMADRFLDDKIRKEKLTADKDKYVMLLEQPYWREEETEMAVKDFNLDVVKQSIGQIVFSDQSIAKRMNDNAKENWKVRAISQSYDSSVYLKDWIYVLNMDSSRMYALDTMMKNNGFVRLYAVPYGYILYKHVEKLLDASYYKKYLRLHGRMPDLEMYIMTGEN